MNKVITVVMMNLSSIPQRLWMSLVTVIAIAVVVAVLLAFLAIGDGFRNTVQGTGSDKLAVMIRSGSQAELNSVLMGDQLNLLSTAPGIASDEEGPLVSGELYLIVDGKKRGSELEANLPFRGLSRRGIGMRDNVVLTQGRMFVEGKNEIVVGESIVREYEGFELGQEVKLRQAVWKVVGVFSTGGSVFESELWTDAKVLQSQFQRGNSYQIVRVALEVPGNVAPIEEFINSDKRLNMEIKTEKEYYQEQAKGISAIIFYIGWPLAIAMAIGALAGALNTMYNSVSQRAGEIATLRAIGFPGFPVFAATLIESLLLSVVGGVIGSVVALVFFDGISTSTMGSGFTQIAFQFDIGTKALTNGILLALIVGFIGGVFPAYRAARMPVLKAFAAAA